MNKLLFVVIVFSAISSAAFGQFEGIIKYNLSVKGNGLERIEAFMPDTFQYHFKNNEMLYKVKGGIVGDMLGDFLVKSNGSFYMIKHDSKEVFEMDKDNSNPHKTSTKPVVIKQAETLTIQGYKCQKYKVITEIDGSKVTTFIWCTTALDLKPPKLKGSNAMSGILYFEGLEGFPLKMVTTYWFTETMGTFGLELVASEVREEKLDTSMFNLPSDYAVKPMDLDKVMRF